jgi:hypothetical protein
MARKRMLNRCKRSANPPSHSWYHAFRKEGMTMPRSQGRHPDKEKPWRRLLKQWQRSELTGRDFCARRQLSEPSFFACKREIARCG